VPYRCDDAGRSLSDACNWLVDNRLNFPLYRVGVRASLQYGQVFLDG
jgi:hypothetical protein